MVFKKVISWFGKDEAASPKQSNDAEKQASTAPVRRRKKDTHEKKPVAPFLPNKATKISRDKHGISRKQISPNALKVLYRLKDNGYEAYLVGGCIRDILLGLEPKDFDVVTNATPEQVKACFGNCRLIGRRFRLAHIMFGREIIEVATMRGHHEEAEADSKPTALTKSSDEGQLLRDNVYGSIDEDAERRDFTINALYYDIRNFEVLDFANGIADIERGVIDLIGDPEKRYREDPVRMLRALRFSTKLHMTIAPRTKDPIFELGHLLRNIPPARLFDETLKMLLGGKAADNVSAMRHYGLFKHFFPITEQVLTGNPDDKEERLLAAMLRNTDRRINAEQSISPAFVLAAMYWYALEAHASELQLEGGLSPYDAFQLAMNDILHRATQSIAIPKRFTATMREIWSTQHRLTKTHGKKPLQLLENVRFRAAYDFLLLRAEAEGETSELHDLAAFWTDLQESDEGKSIVERISRQRASDRSRVRKPRSPRPGGSDRSKANSADNSANANKSKPKRGKYRAKRRRSN